MKKIFIIAEAGVNHNGDIDIAKKLIDVALECEVDAIKFQTFKAENLIAKYAKKPEYQIINSQRDETAFEMIKKLELSKRQNIQLQQYCMERNILFMSSPFDMDSIDELNELNLEIFKIPSGEITNYPYLQKIGSLKKKVILSTGMSTISEVEDAISVLVENGTTDITLLHCNTQYPTPMCDVNLSAMITLQNKFGLKVGYSDHTLGIEVPIAAAALGACVIEKHFTLNKTMPGPDHKASASPGELFQMVRAIRNIEMALGDGVKGISKSETKNVCAIRKSIVASRFIQKGEVLTSDNITTKRPGCGISPMIWNDIVGKVASKDFEKDEMILI